MQVLSKLSLCSCYSFLYFLTYFFSSRLILTL